LSLKEYVKKEFTQAMWLLKTLVVGRKRIRKGLETNRVSWGKADRCYSRCYLQREINGFSYLEELFKACGVRVNFQ